MNKVLIITGGNKGLGLGISNEYHANGYEVISISRSINKDQNYAQQEQCDISDVKMIERTIETIFSKLNPNHISDITLINNAGYLGDVNTLESVEPENIAYTIQVNLVAPLVISSLFIKHTKSWKCNKQLFNISSGAAANPYESWAMYCSSKAGLDMMTRVIATEQSNLENKVNAISIYPGIVDTDMQTQVRNTPKENFKAVQRFIDFYEQDELTTPKQVAKKIYELDKLGKLKNGLILDIRNV